MSPNSSPFSRRFLASLFSYVLAFVTGCTPARATETSPTDTPTNPPIPASATATQEAAASLPAVTATATSTATATPIPQGLVIFEPAEGRVEYEDLTCDIFPSNQPDILSVDLETCSPEIHQNAGIWGTIYDLDGNPVSLQKPDAPLEIVGIQAVPVDAANSQGAFLLGKGLQEGEREYFLVEMSDGTYYIVLPADVIAPAPTMVPPKGNGSGEGDSEGSSGGGGEIGGHVGY